MTFRVKIFIISTISDLFDIFNILQHSASSFHGLSSSIFSFCSSFVRRPALVTSPLIPIIWCFQAYKLYIFCQDLFWQLVICLSSSYDHHIIIGWRPFHHKADKTKQMLVFLKVRNSWFLSYDQFIQFSSYFSKPYTFKAESHTVVHWL